MNNIEIAEKLIIALSKNARCEGCLDVGSGVCGKLDCNDFPRGVASSKCISCNHLLVDDENNSIWCKRDECIFDTIKYNEILIRLAQEG